MKRLLAAAALAVLANTAVASAAETPILPGLWKYSARVLFGIAEVEGGRRCLKASEVERFMAFPGNKHYKCDYNRKTVANGRVDMQGACVDKKGRRAPIRARGTYTPESFRLNINLTTTNGIPLAGVMSAQRVSANCPA
jgi:opacity protein-like surface antigen